MIRAPLVWSFAIALLATPSMAVAQGGDKTAPEADNNMDLRPATTKIGKSSLGALLTDERGRTLYAMDARIARSRYGAGVKYCRDACARKWIAFTAPADAAPVGKWSAVDGAAGPQWAWNGNPVFTYADDSAPGSVAGNGYEDLWSVIAYVPPVPKVVVPAAVSIAYADNAYVMTDDSGRRLFTGNCAKSCGDWQPLNAGLSNRSVGEWRVSREGDRAHWLYKGQTVFVASGDLPAGAAFLRP